MEKPGMTVILGLCLLFAVGCGPSKGLEGSLSVLMDLSYRKVEVLQSDPMQSPPISELAPGAPI